MDRPLHAKQPNTWSTRRTRLLGGVPDVAEEWLSFEDVVADCVTALRDYQAARR